MVKLYLHNPTCLHGIVINWLHTGTILPLHLQIMPSVKSEYSFRNCRYPVKNMKNQSLHSWHILSTFITKL
jgi:hypothetical protein